MNLPTALPERLKQAWTRLCSALAPHASHWRERLRHPSRRDIALAVGSLPAALLLYAIILIPFTPSISDIRKATTERPAQVVFSDGKKLAEFKLANREWVKLEEISPHVIEALIATEDHRFYAHHGIDFQRTASALVHTASGDRQGDIAAAWVAQVLAPAAGMRRKG